jgi:hypothetical protein
MEILEIKNKNITKLEAKKSYADHGKENII